jgi:hypothetical protein
MKKYLFILIIGILSCDTKQPDVKRPPVDKFNCLKGEMKAAWYEAGKDEISSFNLTDEKFSILVDTNNKAINFISESEDLSRNLAMEKDTSKLSRILVKEIMSNEKKMELINEFRRESLIYADSQHYLNNNGKIQVWLLNNSDDTIYVQMRDACYICILQALTKEGEWLPIQYHIYSSCGNSYYDKPILKKMANSFVMDYPNSGDYTTKLRFELSGRDKSYYSNEFIGKIDYCEFVRDTISKRRN